MTGSRKDEAGKKQSVHGEVPHVEASAWADDGRLIRRRFSGPAGVTEPLRIDIEPRALVDVIAHASETLEAEVCGVLAGEACEDDEGPFVHVTATVRAPATRQGRAHVTFTQETWDAVHRAMDAHHPGLRIVGWYHSHPGFGVEFSEMDAFIQQNFFPQPTQAALVFDPLSGALGACVGSPDGIRRIGRLWVGGRERLCDQGPAGRGSGQAGSAGILALESRVSQVVEALDEVRASVRRFLAMVGVAVGIVLALFLGSWIHREFFAPHGGAQIVRVAPVALQVDGRRLLLDLGVILEWAEDPEPPPTTASPDPAAPSAEPAVPADSGTP